VTWLSVFDLLAGGPQPQGKDKEELLDFWNRQRAEIMAFRDKEYPGSKLWPETLDEDEKEIME
jgi:hypothetical protein